MLTFERISATGRDRIAVEIENLIIAGWAGRDAAAIEHHIEELAALGIPRPSTTPVYYRVAAANLTQADRFVVLGPDSSGEVEPVVVSLADGLWMGVGSDHTDRKAEAAGIALSKQLCGNLSADSSGATRRSSPTGPTRPAFICDDQRRTGPQVPRGSGGRDQAGAR